MGLREHDEDVVGKGWKIVEKNQNKISALVMDMLTFSKEREPDLMLGNLNDTIHDVVELMNVRAEEFQVELTWQPCDSMPDLIFDPEGIHRAVLNVVTNAIDAVAEKQPPGKVAVRTEYDAENTLARIVVEDNGPGIPADQMDHLFSPFVSSKKSRGTGLGLPVSQKIIREHGGKLLVDSQAGRGARFTFELPAAQPKNENAREGTATMTREELEREVEN
jgi:signal transduction histidine kinase